jgi:hypothetical protein
MDIKKMVIESLLYIIMKGSLYSICKSCFLDGKFREKQIKIRARMATCDIWIKCISSDVVRQLGVGLCA